MKQSFKNYLITERVQQQDFNTIVNDPNNLIGIEFEYFDDAVKEEAQARSGGANQEIINAYDSFIEEVEEYMNRYNVWIDDMTTLIKDKYYELENLVTELTEKYDELDEEFDDLKNKIDELDAEIEDLEDEDVDSNEIEGKKNELIQLKARLEKVETERDEVENEKDEAEEQLGILPDPKNYIYFLGDYDEYYDIVDDLEDDFGEYPPEPDYNLDDYWRFYADRDYYDRVRDSIFNYMNGATSSFELPDNIYPPEEGDGLEIDEDFNEIIQTVLDETWDFPFPKPLIGKTNKKRWGIVPDGSLPLIDGGIEIVSPIMVLKDGLNAMEQMFDFIEHNGHTSTHPPTGLHINVSYKGFDTSKVDVFKMILFMEEGYVEKDFKTRTQNSMVTFLRPRIQDIIRVKDMPAFLEAMRNDEEYKKINDSLKRMLNKIIPKLMPSSQKKNAINFSNADVKRGRIEFRYLGDEGYHRKYDIVKRNIVRFFYFLKLGVDKEFQKDEYLRRVVNLISKEKIGVTTSDIELAKIAIGKYNFTKKDSGSEGNIFAIIPSLENSKYGNLYTTPDKKFVIFNDHNYRGTGKISVNKFSLLYKKYPQFFELTHKLGDIRKPTVYKNLVVKKNMIGKEVTINGKKVKYSIDSKDTYLIDEGEIYVLFGYNVSTPDTKEIVRYIYMNTKNPNDILGLRVTHTGIVPNFLRLSSSKIELENLPSFVHYE